MVLRTLVGWCPFWFLVFKRSRKGNRYFGKQAFLFHSSVGLDTHVEKEVNALWAFWFCLNACSTRRGFLLASLEVPTKKVIHYKQLYGRVLFEGTQHENPTFAGGD